MGRVESINFQYWETLKLIPRQEGKFKTKVLGKLTGFPLDIIKQ